MDITHHVLLEVQQNNSYNLHNEDQQEAGEVLRRRRAEEQWDTNTKTPEQPVVSDQGRSISKDPSCVSVSEKKLQCVEQVAQKYTSWVN